MAPDRASPGYAWLISAAVLLSVLAPLARPAGVDSFPWSSYPMFAHGRPSPITGVHHLLAIDAAGNRRPVPPALVANDEVLQADVTIQRAIRRGKKTSVALCRAVAARLAGHPDWRDAVRVELVSEKFDAIQYFAGDRTPLGKPRLRARCKVKRA